MYGLPTWLVVLITILIVLAILALLGVGVNVD